MTPTEQTTTPSGAAVDVLAVLTRHVRDLHEGILYGESIVDMDAVVVAVAALIARNAELEASRVAYAHEFAPDEEGLPNVGSIHENIRGLMAERDARAAEAKALREALERAITDDGGTCRVDDGPGSRVCCGAKEFYPHEPRCWVLSAGEALARTPAATTKENDDD